MELTKLNDLKKLRRNSIVIAIFLVVWFLIVINMISSEMPTIVIIVCALFLVPLSMKIGGIFYATVYFNSEIVEISNVFKDDKTIPLHAIRSMKKIFEPNRSFFDFPHPIRRFRIFYSDVNGNETSDAFTIQLDSVGSANLESLIDQIKYHNPRFYID